MASLSEQAGRGLWRITFYDADRDPKRAYLYYPHKSADPQGYSSSEIVQLKKELEWRYKRGLFNPWAPDAPATEGVITLDQAITLYKSHYGRRLAASTLSERMILLNALRRQYGNRELHRLPDGFWNDWINAPDKFATRQYRYTLLKGMYDMLAGRGFVLPASLEVIGQLREKNRRRMVTSERWITQAEMLALVDAIGPQAQATAAKSKYAHAQPAWYMADIIRLGFYTGMRRADLLALRPSWIRDDCRVVRIGGDYDPKSQLPEEVMPTIPQARPILERLRRDTAGNNRIFPYSPDRVTKRFKALTRYALPGKKDSVTFHSLRHSFVMYCMDELKLRDRLIMQLTRHKDQRSLAKYKHHNVDAALDELDRFSD